MTQTTRAARPDVVMRLDPDFAQVSFPAACGGAIDMDDTLMMIRRAGGCPDEWLLAYRPFDQDADGNVSFRFDGALHDLKPGYYDAVIMEGCDPCGTIRFDKTKRPSLHMRAVSAMAFTECPPPGEALPGTGHSDMLDAYVGWTSKISCALTKTDLTIKTDDELPDLPDGATVQLVLRDGVATETVTVTAVNGETLTVERGSPAAAFPKGACIQFEWTIENIRTVANESCPVPDPGDDTMTGGTGDDSTAPKSAVLEVGKGLVLETDEEGRIVLSLASTGVAPGDYGGLQVDECGRVTVVDAQFPANAVPVFDGCCKDD